MPDYDKGNCTEVELGRIFKDNKSFVRVAYITHDITGKQFIDIRSGYMKNNCSVVKANGIQLELYQVPELASVLNSYLNGQIIRGC